MYRPQLFVYALVTLFTALLVWPTSVSVTSISTCPAANFNAAPTSPVGSEPLFIVSGDFNGDTHTDFAVANDQPDHNVSILIGDGTGRFSAAARIEPSDLVSLGFLAVGDFNHDGKQDLAAASVGYGAVLIMLGDGHGAFSTPVSYPAGLKPYQIVVTDLNADGLPDLAVGDRERTPDNASHVWILMGTPGGFAAARAIQVRTPPVSLDAGDVNGDGKIDLISGGGDASTELIGDGAGNFSQVPLDGLTKIGSVVKIADFNNDHKADLFIRESSGGTQVRYGDGAGAFPTRTQLHVFATTDAAVGDFNSDGLNDMALVRLSGVTVLLGVNGGGFDRKDYAAGSRPNRIVLSDVNNDAKLDLVALNSKSYDVSILLGNGTGEFAASRNHPTRSPDVGGSPGGIVSADFNEDGNLDMAALNFHTRDVALLLGDGQGGFTTGSITNIGPLIPRALAMADVDLDGNLDLLVRYVHHTDLGRLLGNGDGTFKALRLQWLQAFDTHYVTAFDFNGDGKSDVAMLMGNTLFIALHVAPETFAPPKTWVVGNEAVSISVGDLNGDGKLDVIVPKTNGIHREYDGLWIGLGDGAGDFSSSRIMEVGSAPFGATIGDFNGDGKADIAVAAVAPPNFGGVSIFIGDGTGEFTLRESHETAPGHREIKIGDFNADGVQDLAVIGMGWNAVSILLGQGNGSFSEATNYGTGADPKHLVIGDFNEDGKSDVMISNYTSGDITALLSTPCVVATPTPTPTPAPTSTPPPTPSPSPATPPVLLTEDNSNRAIALDSVTLLSDPFPLETNQNFSADGRTRILLFALNADLLPGENLSAVTVNGFAGGQNYPMTVEYVGKVTGTTWWTQIVVRLPDGLPSGDILVTMSLHGMNSNQAVIKIRLYAAGATGQ